MKRTMIFLVVVLATTPASAFAQTVVLKTSLPPEKAWGQPDRAGRVTITLASGTKITVPITDIDVAGTQASVPSGSAEPSRAAGASDDSLRSKCQAQWKDDFQMQKYCIGQQQEAVAALNGRPMTSANERTIRTKCTKDWPDDFQMRNYCETEQLKALKSLGR